MKKAVLLIGFSCFISLIQGKSQSVAINNDASTPAAGAMLEIKSTSKGILVPRITLTGTNDVVTVPVRPNALLIYNMNTVSGPNAVSTGFYYWNGSLWIRVITSENNAFGGWLLGGNSGTIAGTHFIGTTDFSPLTFKVNNQQAGYVGTGATSLGYQALPGNTGLFNTAIGLGAFTLHRLSP